MGVYGSYNGNMHIQEERKEEFTENVIKLLNYGGMMQLEQVCMYGKKIALIKPVEMDAEGIASFHYNYFEDDVWEQACYEENGTYFSSEKIGSREFCDVVTAVYALYELYDENIGFTQIDGDIVEISPCVGWINHVLGTKFSIKKRFCLWKYFEKYCLDRRENEEDDPEKYYDVMGMVPPDLYTAMGGTDFADIWYIRKGTGSLDPGELISGSYPDMIYQCRELLHQYFEDKNGSGQKEAWDTIKALVVSGKKEREKRREGKLGMIAQMSLKIPAHMLLFLACEIEKKDFWMVWKELYEKVYTDEEMTGYAPDELAEERKAAIEKVIDGMTTAEYLCQNDSFAFWNTPEELKGKPDYCLSDDDRAFWWDGSGEVVFSKEMEEWLTELSVQHKQIMNEIMIEEKREGKFLDELLSLLEETETFYKRVYCFQSMFYEFLQNGRDKRYVAAVRLLGRLVQENREKGKVIEHMHMGWDITSRNVTHNEGRMAIKRYLSVMANKALRKQYFGF